MRASHCPIEQLGTEHHENSSADVFEKGRAARATQRARDQRRRSQGDNDSGSDMRQGKNARYSHSTQLLKTRSDEIGRQDRLAVAGRHGMNCAEQNAKRQN